MKQADLKRQQQTLRTARLNLAAERLRFEREQRRQEVEREELRREVANLHVQLARAGADIANLTRLLAEAHASVQPSGATRTRQAARSAVNPRVTPPAPLRPTPVPQPEHRCIVVPWQDAGRIGHRARCICGWASGFEADEARATQTGDFHVQRFAPLTSVEHRRQV